MLRKILVLEIRGLRCQVGQLRRFCFSKLMHFHVGTFNSSQNIQPIFSLIPSMCSSMPGMIEFMVATTFCEDHLMQLLHSTNLIIADMLVRIWFAINYRLDTMRSIKETAMEDQEDH